MSIDFKKYMNTVSRKLCGPANERMYKPEELRFGTNGSMCIDLKAGTFYDHENKVGGGVLDLIRHKTGKANGEAIEWLKVTCGIVENNANKPQSVGRSRIAKIYDYCDLSGNVIYQVVRLEPKSFFQQRPDGNGGYIKSIKGVTQVPYRSPDLTKKDYVLIVEGEKDVDRLWSLGISATCNAMGAGKWPKELNPYFSGKKVFIIPDNDDAGRKHAELVAGNLKDTAASVRICRICSEMPEKSDISDWLDAEK
jgi:putative DNA primase/helicase